MFRRLKRWMLTSGRAQRPTPHCTSPDLLLRWSTVWSSWVCTYQLTSPGTWTPPPPWRKPNNVFTVLGNWRRPVSLLLSSYHFTGEPLRASSAATSLSGTETAPSWKEVSGVDSEDSREDHWRPSPTHLPTLWQTHHLTCEQHSEGQFPPLTWTVLPPSIWQKVSQHQNHNNQTLQELFPSSSQSSQLTTTKGLIYTYTFTNTYNTHQSTQKQQKPPQIHYKLDLGTTCLFAHSVT